MQQQSSQTQNEKVQSLALWQTQEQSLTDKEIDIARVLYKVNAIKEYPLSDDMIVVWAKTITELRGWVTPEHLNNVMNRFILGDLDWEKSEGIQNVFRGIHATSRPEHEYEKQRK